MIGFPNILRGRGPLSISGGGTPPTTPALTIADKMDGTGATATIAGSDVGSTERVYYGRPGAIGAAYVSRSGDGAVSIPLTTNGVYSAYVVSVAAGLPSFPSGEVGFTVSGAAITATSTLALSVDKLRSAVSQSATFQAARGVGNALDALPFVYGAGFMGKDDREWAAARPFAVVLSGAEISYLQDFGGSRNFLHTGGVAYLFVEKNDDDPTAFYDSYQSWANFYGGILDDLAAIAGFDDNLAIRQIVSEASVHSDEDSRNAQQPFWRGLARVEWFS